MSTCIHIVWTMRTFKCCMISSPVLLRARCIRTVPHETRLVYPNKDTTVSCHPDTADAVAAAAIDFCAAVAVGVFSFWRCLRNATYGACLHAEYTVASARFKRSIRGLTRFNGHGNGNSDSNSNSNSSSSSSSGGKGNGVGNSISSGVVSSGNNKN